jgi:3-oxoacyl-(acyl-carrier-protein) synthase
VHPDIAEFAAKIPHQCMEFLDLKIVAKAGFGFGDVNSCIIFKKWEEK